MINMQKILDASSSLLIQFELINEEPQAVEVYSKEEIRGIANLFYKLKKISRKTFDQLHSQADNCDLPDSFPLPTDLKIHFNGLIKEAMREIDRLIKDIKEDEPKE